jgi:hypothetical protein
LSGFDNSTPGQSEKSRARLVFSRINAAVETLRAAAATSAPLIWFNTSEAIPSLLNFSIAAADNRIAPVFWASRLPRNSFAPSDA